MFRYLVKEKMLDYIVSGIMKFITGVITRFHRPNATLCVAEVTLPLHTKTLAWRWKIFNDIQRKFCSICEKL